MKKISLLLVLMCSFFMSGCSNNTSDYASLGEYRDAISKVRDSYKTFTIKTHSRADNMITDSTLFIKNNKWKNVYTTRILDIQYLLFELLGEKQINTNLYDGGDSVAAYGGLDPDYYELNPVSSGYYKKLDDPFLNMIFEPFVLLSTYKFEYRMTKKNGFQCRLIKSNNADVCISDKYGIAVYYKVKAGRGFLTTNVKEIDTSDISDSEFELPKNMKLVPEGNFVEIEDEWSDN